MHRALADARRDHAEQRRPRRFDRGIAQQLAHAGGEHVRQGPPQQTNRGGGPRTDAVQPGDRAQHGKGAPQHDRAVQQPERRERRQRPDVARAARDQPPGLAIEGRQHGPPKQPQPLAVVQGIARLPVKAGQRLGEIGAAAIQPLQLREIGLGLAVNLGGDQPFAHQA